MLLFTGRLEKIIACKTTEKDIKTRCTAMSRGRTPTENRKKAPNIRLRIEMTDATAKVKSKGALESLLEINTIQRLSNTSKMKGKAL